MTTTISHLTIVSTFARCLFEKKREHYWILSDGKNICEKLINEDLDKAEGTTKN